MPASSPARRCRSTAASTCIERWRQESVPGNGDTGNHAAGGPVGNREGKAISVGNRLRDGQAETCPLYFRRGGTKEAIEDPRQRLRGDLAARIDDLDPLHSLLRS